MTPLPANHDPNQTCFIYIFERDGRRLLHWHIRPSTRMKLALSGRTQGRYGTEAHGVLLGCPARTRREAHMVDTLLAAAPAQQDAPTTKPASSPPFSHTGGLPHDERAVLPPASSWRTTAMEDLSEYLMHKATGPKTAARYIMAPDRRALPCADRVGRWRSLRKPSYVGSAQRRMVRIRATCVGQTPAGTLTTWAPTAPKQVSRPGHMRKNADSPEPAGRTGR